MVLGYSRHMFARIVFDQKTETWLRLHVEAFEKLGGVVDTVVPDNLKAAVVRAAFAIDDETALNRSYRELARHYNFKIDPAPPRKPKKKGKVESGVKYVKRNGLAGREDEDVTVANPALDRWVAEIAGTRKHGTTGRQPLAVFEAEERSALKPSPAVSYELVEWKDALVYPDTHVAFRRRLYSVPWTLLGKTVWIRGTRTSVVVYFDDERVATHDRNGPGNRSTIEAHLPEHRADLRHRSRSYWEDFDFHFNPQIPKAKVLELATCAFTERHENVLLVGQAGVTVIVGPASEAPDAPLVGWTWHPGEPLAPLAPGAVPTAVKIHNG